MALYIFITIISFLIHFILIVPFIDFLYKMKFQRAKQETKDAFNKPTPIFDLFHQHKSGTPVGGGILVTIVTLILSLFFIILLHYLNVSINSNYPNILAEISIIVFTFGGFALLGIYDDLEKIFVFDKSNFFGLQLRNKLIIEVGLALFISFLIYQYLKISIIYVPFLGVFDLSYFYILFSAFVILAFANAVNITDGLDGLSSGTLSIALVAFWAVAATIIDVPLSIFIAVWLGGLIAFLYFNIHPARIFLGDTGALAFGAGFAVVGLILGKAFALPIIGGVFVVEIATSLLQLLSKRYRKKKLFPVAPAHLYLQYIGWEEGKIVMRFWIIGAIFALIGLFIAFMK
ncbi:phospho-N-acetylmuramoyl-pentapeptide-transferase [Candidatus Woesebacteria bacterium]|nr:phospho-N-acetylmuramoyl-pentapeptide-transferase [Candidatus Woesebacteria bacterium]